MPQYKLHYFDIYGRAEPIRILFYLGGVEYEDRRWSFAEWPEIKKEPIFTFGQAPLLEVDGKPLAQTIAIARFVANQVGYASKDEFEAARQDSIVDFISDYQEKLVPWYRIKLGFLPGDEQAELEKLKPAQVDFFTKLSDILEKEGTGYLVGSSLSWVDIILYHHNYLFNLVIPGYFDDYKVVADFNKRIENLPKIQEYLAQRKQCER
ncbi:unnamed protein product, partial [Mesorhabditis belari]|uniref:glutathione transferase n=1 Tax=Mesorhabditis belari TaxID=2138241 RepID=A0AAF3FHL7_9BILA